MTLAEFNHWTSYLTNVTAAGLLIRLLWMGLAKRYAWLFGYFLADILQAVLVIGAPRNSRHYGYVYLGGQAAKTLLAAGLAMQLWWLALRAYPALARFGRRTVVSMIVAALLAAAAGQLLEPPRSGIQSPFMHFFNAFEGGADSLILLFLVAGTLFLLWFPVQIPRNVALFIAGFVLFLLQRWAGLLLINQYPNSARAISAVMLCVEAGFPIFCILAVRHAGEVITTVTGHRWNAHESERLLGQLDAINARLERMARQ